MKGLKIRQLPSNCPVEIHLSDKAQSGQTLCSHRLLAIGLSLERRQSRKSVSMSRGTDWTFRLGVWFLGATCPGNSLRYIRMGTDFRQCALTTPLRYQTTGALTWYLPQSHYPDTELTCPCSILIILSAWLTKKRQSYISKSFMWIPQGSNPWVWTPWSPKTRDWRSTHSDRHICHSAWRL